MELSISNTLNFDITIYNLLHVLSYFPRLPVFLIHVKNTLLASLETQFLNHYLNVSTVSTIKTILLLYSTRLYTLKLKCTHHDNDPQHAIVDFRRTYVF
jgi:hypothetical protein